MAKENVLSPLAKLTKGIQNIGASLKKEGGPSTEVEVAAKEAFAPVDGNDEKEDDLKERARNTQSRTKFLIL